MVLVGAIGVIVRSHPVHAALSLVLTLFGVAVLFVAQEAHFLAAVQVIVYAGAIVVLFLFVIMLLGVDKVENIEIEPIPVQRPLAVIVGAGLLAMLVTAVVQARSSIASGMGSPVSWWRAKRRSSSRSRSQYSLSREGSSTRSQATARLPREG